MTTPIKIDFVSDVSCPWCIVGLGGLEEALRRVGDLVDADIHFQPFELNPAMAPEGENFFEYIGKKYGTTREQSAANLTMLAERAAGVGFTMARSERSRVYNTFDAHRLLHWAEGSGHQAELKHKLLEAYFTHGLDPSNQEVLVTAAANAGLDPDEAREVLTSGRYTEEVRAAEDLWRSRGISSVPAVIINGKYLISGGQPVEAFEKTIRQIAAEAETGS